ncbi:hypothetical protein SAMN05216188_13022 [Lentzea xinjiangensis]|uniref:PE family protein n=1 Tax=Lentzea xinjiangensis TaxID=402600 RepID=A0A1H9W301_9PSEU|nr:hypothetical protein [Lentzea xinjiangensis]SES28057.1 hypothetical protein SAMN05216188_13022 [Lentzea xinjiangensis]
MVRVDSRDEAERLKEALRDGRAAEVVGPVSGIGLVGVPTTGADRIEVDPADFDQAIRHLHRRRDELAGHLADSAVLAAPLPDGKGPVAVQMRKAFGLRARDVEGGVRAALQSYVQQLDLVIDALENVKKTHAAVDENTAAAFEGQA